MGRGAVIEAEVNELCGVLNSRYARLVDLVVELLADRRLWQGDGVWTMSGWLSWRCGVSPATARDVVAVAERVDDLPESVAAFRAGELSLDQMAAIARRAPWWTDAQIRKLGSKLTVTQIRRTLASYPFPEFDDDGREVRSADPCAAESSATDADDGLAAAEPARADDASRPEFVDAGAGPRIEEWLSMGHDDVGGFRLQMATDSATGATIESALVEARDRLFNAGQVDVTWVDAVRELAHASFDRVEPRRRARFRTNLHLAVDEPLTDAQRRRLPDAIARHVTCDGTISPVFTDGARPVSVGRAQRVVPTSTRTVVEHRDGGTCRVPGCDMALWLEVHHVVHWQEGGPTETFNLVCVCGHHHRQHHRGALGITGNADLADGDVGALVFTDSRGRVIRPSGASPLPPTDEPPPPTGTFAHPLGERLDSRWLYFNPPNVLGLTRPRRTRSPSADDDGDHDTDDNNDTDNGNGDVRRTDHTDSTDSDTRPGAA